MTSSGAVPQARENLGAVGALLGVMPAGPPAPVQVDAARRLQQAGWPALWSNELVGTDALTRSALWLAATETLTIGTGIANAWARPPQTAHAAATLLSQAHPGRFVLGVGVGHPEQAAQVGAEFGSPVQIARRYLQELAPGDYPRILAANGPRLLALAAELTDGALPAGRPPQATGEARAVLGADKLLVVYVSITAAQPAGEIAALAAEHRAAGADHVVVGMSYNADFDVAVTRLAELGPELAAVA